MKNLKSKLKNLGAGLGIAGLSLLPMKSLAQETQNNTQKPTGFYYWNLGGSINRFNNLALDEYFGAVLGMKGGIGLNSGKLSRIEFEAEIASKKNKDEDIEISTLGVGAYYDIILNPNNKMLVYGGAGIKALSLTLSDQSEQVKTSGIGYGIRGGVEGKIGEKSTLYLEVFYNNISGTHEEESTNLNSSGLTFGIRGNF